MEQGRPVCSHLPTASIAVQEMVQQKVKVTSNFNIVKAQRKDA
jgi:hypothetical protein